MKKSELMDSVIGVVYKTRDSMTVLPPKVGAVGWKQISLEPFKRVKVLGWGRGRSEVVWLSLCEVVELLTDRRTDNLGKVYTTEDGFKLAKPESDAIGWLVTEVSPKEERVRVAYFDPVPFWCKFGSLG